MMPSDAGTLTATLIPPPPLTRPNLSRLALFLDLDGVLAPIAPTPTAVMPSPRRTRILTRLQQRLDGRVAIISGRTIAEVDRICDGAVRAVSGIHGLERRDAAGQVFRARPSPGLAGAYAAMADFARSRPGVLVEDKGLAVGLHYRGAPAQAVAAQALGRDLAARYGLTAQPGNMIIELKTPGSDKGTALTGFMNEAPFEGARPLMLGDDQTDEFAFAAARPFGGAGVLVGPPRATAALYGFRNDDLAMDWLEMLGATS